jgi:predicted dehydrogenase
MLRLAVIGYGYWGPNLVRNFRAQPDCRVVSICDRQPPALARAEAQFPGIVTTTDAEEVLAAHDIDAVAIATPVSTHYALARTALDHGKHVFVEKPLTAASAEAEDLIARAERGGRVLMVDHTFLFTGAVRKIKELVDGGVLGRLYYYDSTRVNLGLFQHDVNVIWDLAPHDFAVIDHLFGLEPEQVVATGQAHLNGHEDLAYITLYFPTDVIAHVNVNWLSPLKVRTTLLGGDKRMLVWNDLEPGEKLKVYDKGVEITSQQGIYDAMVSYRSGDMWAPRLEEGEALQREARHFLDCIATGVRPISDGRAGWRVVRMLEAAQRSVERRGAPVTLGLGEPAPVPAGARRGASAWRPAPVAIPSRP